MNPQRQNKNYKKNPFLAKNLIETKNMFAMRGKKKKNSSGIILCVQTSNTLRVNSYTQLDKIFFGVQDETAYWRTLCSNNEAKKWTASFLSSNSSQTEVSQILPEDWSELSENK